MRGLLYFNDRKIRPIERSASLTARSCSYVKVIEKKQKTAQVLLV